MRNYKRHTRTEYTQNKVRDKSRECHNHKQQRRGRGNRQNQTSANRTNVQKALRLAISSTSEVIAMLKGLKIQEQNNTRQDLKLSASYTKPQRNKE